MKKLFLLFTLAFIALSCEQIQDFIDEKGHGLVFLEGEMKAYFDDKGDTKNYKFKADLAWSAEVSADWVVVNPTSGPAGENKIQIKVDKNKSNERRTGYVDITLSNDKSYRIELEQLAAGESLDDVIEPTNSCPSNEIWYTSADGNIVEPYSGEGSQDNFAVFGANIVSNTFDAEKECWVIKFDGDVTSIGYAAFAYCISLTSVTIPDSVTTIEEWAFRNCSSLTSVTIPDSVTTIGDAAFRDCSSLTSVTIPDSVTTIGYQAFDSCSSLTSVTIPDGVTTIEWWAFFDCSSLTSITIPDSVTTIGINAFCGCSNLREFNGKYASEDGRCLIFNSTLNSFAPAGLTEYTIPDGVTAIGMWAFGYCSSLTSVTIGDSVTTIEFAAFYGCSSLTSVYITDLSAWCKIDFGGYDENPLYYAKNLYLNNELVIDLVIPSDIAEIKPYAFQGYSSLTSITIPDSVTEIGYCAFDNCDSLTSVYCKATTPPTAEVYGSYWRAFDYNASGRTIYVPIESVEAYKSAEGWSDYADAIVGYEF